MALAGMFLTTRPDTPASLESDDDARQEARTTSSLPAGRTGAYPQTHAAQSPLTLSDTIELVLLKDATAEMVDEALDSVADALVRSPKLRPAFHSRREAMGAGDLPPALWLLSESGRCIGWCGWVPYAERPGHWQTTTYFAQTHRGAGLFERARCQQIHDMGAVRAWEAERSVPPGPFMLSIADWNTRSLKASRRYTADNGWSDTWEQAYEPLANRNAHLFFFPSGTPDHRCFKPALCA